MGFEKTGSLGGVDQRSLLHNANDNIDDPVFNVPSLANIRGKRYSINSDSANSTRSLTPIPQGVSSTDQEMARLNLVDNNSLPIKTENIKRKTKITDNYFFVSTVSKIKKFLRCSLKWALISSLVIGLIFASTLIPGVSFVLAPYVSIILSLVICSVCLSLFSGISFAITSLISYLYSSSLPRTEDEISASEKDVQILDLENNLKKLQDKVKNFPTKATKEKRAEIINEFISIIGNTSVKETNFRHYLNKKKELEELKNIFDKCKNSLAQFLKQTFEIEFYTPEDEQRLVDELEIGAGKVNLMNIEEKYNIVDTYINGIEINDKGDVVPILERLMIWT